MKKITLFIPILLFTLLFFLSNSVYANKNTKRIFEKSYSWDRQIFAPELDLQPYFTFRNLTALAAPCVVQTLPFWEGFNTDSTTSSCWTILDNNKDKYNWETDDYDYSEGDQSMYFYGNSKNDDWLISPTLKLDATKTYRLKYQYMTDTYGNNEFEVVASNKGLAVADFTKAIVANKIYKTSDWTQETAYITNLGGDVNLAWHVTAKSNASINLDAISIEEVACVEPQNLAVKNLKIDQATVYWKDLVNTSWEYYVEDTGGNGPTTAGSSSSTTEVIVTKDHNNKNLVAGAIYDFYVRAKCANGTFGEWIGPFSFKTLCKAINAPFVEGFNSTSTTYGCWLILDNNKDAASPTDSKIWKQHSSDTFEGDRVMYFNGSSSAGTHDDWLISPSIKMNGGLYAIIYYYKTSNSYNNEFEVVLSKNGVNPTEFTTQLEASEKRNTNIYKKKTLYVQNITGDVNIAWHILGKAESKVYIDLVSVQEVSCYAPEEEMTVSKLEKDKATVTWTDTKNTSWEYYVQLEGAGPAPIGSGLIANKPSTEVTKTTGVGGANLQPNTWYEFFVRASCGAGKTSLWVGPIKFKTPCAIGVLPFWEGFNTDSKNIDCWTIVDNNNDGGDYNKIWMVDDYQKFEGDQSMHFSGSWDAYEHDDWLISPTFKLDPTKMYRLKYHYKTSSSEKTDFDVLLSNKGIALSDFTTNLMTKKNYTNGNWQEKTHVLRNVSGNINIAWHVSTQGSYTDLYVDNVFIEEIIGCPEPVDLDSKDLKENGATIFWADDVGKNWEFVIQKLGGKAPVAAGTATAKKENVVTKDQAGNNLLPNTEYEYYVRSDCGNGSLSIWSGPYKFRTACSVISLPFWEGFNSNSTAIYCWTIIDGNGDGDDYSGNWNKTTYNQYEGSDGMVFEVDDYDEMIHTDDWLISPIFKFDKNKIYRLKYHYKAGRYADASDFEVLASNSGIKPVDFKKEIVKNQVYSSNTYQQKIVFITNLDGNVNLAWHVKGVGSKEVYIDNVFVEEVLGCPEPLNLAIKDVEAKKATISWTDDFKATSWEYFVQAAGTGVPTTGGTVTTKKENVLLKDQAGKNIEPNTDYEYYVRTVCGNGSFSIWAGPFKFVTLCDVYVAPFWEGFNTDSKTIRCWQVLDGNNDGDPDWGGNMWGTDKNSFYEGNRSMAIDVSDWGGDAISDDWLITPDLVMDNSMYVLKYHYKVSPWDGGSFEVLLSTGGKTVDKFTKTIVASAAYSNSNWVEEVKFFTAVAGTNNLAWHVDAEGALGVYIDNVSIKKVTTCPEPYFVKVTNQTTNSFDVTWKQDGGITSWEVIVLNYGDDITATPVKTANVTVNPKTTINGLDPGKKYTVYVRTKCPDGKSNSDWSSPANTGTKIGVNIDCKGALNIPVNLDAQCIKYVQGTLFGSNVSTKLEPTCGTKEVKKDAWFEFTANNITHMLNISDFFSISGAGFPTIYVSVYDVDCSTIGNTALMCFELENYMKYYKMDNLVVGKKYYLRLATTEEFPDFYFNLCINSPSYIDVSPSGTKYTVEQLVKEVLVVADCDLVSNVTYHTGTNYGSEPNGIGYFEKNKSSFSFKDGIVLATNGVETAKGPGDYQNQTDGSMSWLGDKDLQNLLVQNGQPDENFNASVIEFDFIPITDSIKFDFIFASNEYGPSYQCDYSDVFAFFLTDKETGEMTNLAVIPNTDIPVSVTTIHDEKYQGDLTCGSLNEQYFDKYYDGDIGLPLQDNPINYAGMTVPMTAVSAVKPGKKYHIKLAIADYRDSGYNSAVFLRGGSFDLGRIDLGNDLLVETGNALCSGESRIIKSGVMTEGVVIKWYKDDVVIPGADQPDLEVFETGTYKITVKFLDLNCESTGSVKVEIYPAISTVVAAPKALPICRKATAPIVLDLTEVEPAMLSKVDVINYKISYYKTKEDAVAGVAAIVDPTSYGVETIGTDVILFIKVVDQRTSCSEIFEWTLKATKGITPESREQVKVCASYTLPDLEVNQHYYSESAGKGTAYKVGDILNEAGEHTIYVLQDNGNGCYEEISYKVAITAAVKADVFADVELECLLHVLAPLSAHNKYFTQAGGQGIELAVGSLVPHTQTIYVYASSDDGLCVEESSFKVSYKDCPIPKGISPNGDGLNDRFDLKEHGVSSMVIYNRYGAEVYSFAGAYTDQWYGQDKGGKQLPDGTYYYVVVAHGKTRTGWVQINK